MNNKVHDTIVNYLAEITGYGQEDITISKSLVNDLGLDSMMIMDFLRLLVHEFPEMKEMDLEEVFQQEDTTVGSIIILVQQELGIIIDRKSTSIIDDFSEVKEFHQYLESRDYVPYFRKNNGIASNKIIIDGLEKVNFSTYNYLGINGTTEINQAVNEAISRYGTSVSGSRLLSGEIDIHQELERKIADFIGAEDAIIQVGGHSTNVNTIGNIVNEEDLILHDALAGLSTLN